jgi:copper chaperone for superoxide dismutase
MVEVAPSMTIVDLSIRGLSPGTYHATVREAGDISQGPESTGGIWEALKAKQEGKPCRGIFGTVEVGKGGVGSVFLDKPIQIWEMIGRSIVVAKQQDGKARNNLILWPWRCRILTSNSLIRTIQIHWSVSSHEVLACGTVSASQMLLMIYGVCSACILTYLEDDKTVCSCSGKTVWQEREEQRDRGML